MSATEKLSIYDDPSPEWVLVPTSPSRLERAVGRLRMQVQSMWHTASGKTQRAVESVIGTEKGVEHQLKSLHAPEEQLSPALLYVGVAALTGSIMTRNRNIALRILTPPIFFGAASMYLLPRTTDNVRNFAYDIEKRKAPALANAHQQLYDAAGSFWSSAKHRASSAVNRVDNAVEGTTQKLKEGTGLAFPKNVERASIKNVPTRAVEQDQAESAAKLE